MSRRILLIDDDADVRSVVKLCLEMSQDWSVQTASSGMEGCAIAAQHPFDAILLDVMMPDLDGIATLERLRQQPQTQTVPIIFLTAKDPTEYEVFQGYDVQGVLSKLIEPLQFAEQVATLLHWPL
ncbi:response regulator [Spirulina major CS-329]|jgi:CheY-like chemotaxis protein|uniref:response regulator n=1 Tax=Spirulina TaxID=1154 RepID=UPI00232E00AE|nr:MULTISPECIES: response regulator [Spirulina]MDB9494064.1 response regulator [Spirulina subsalsa CS-330]MDB9504910.1 response regulator [Spirulina major CS-329]